LNIWDRLYTKPSTIYSAWPVANNLFNEWLAAIDKNAIRHFAGSSYKVHLDVACGTGRLFDPGLARFYIGVDASLPALILAKRRLPRTTTDFVQGVAESLPFKDDANCIELTICYGLLEYVENQSALNS
jgi:ubiquinone/menaquinone biosynthesis C-methylase UbiE